MESGGEWGNEVWADPRSARNIGRQFRGESAHPCMSVRRNGLVREITKRLHEDGRFTEHAVSNENQYCVNTMLNHGGLSAYQFVFGSNPIDLYFWEDNDRDVDFAHNASVSIQFALQWKLRAMARGALPKEIATNKRRRTLDRNQTFDSADIAIGDSVIFYKQISRKSTPKWRSAAVILDIDETGVTVKFPSQTHKIARFCVRERATSSPGTQFGTAGVGTEVLGCRGDAASGSGFWIKKKPFGQ